MEWAYPDELGRKTNLKVVLLESQRCGSQICNLGLWALNEISVSSDCRLELSTLRSLTFDYTHQEAETELQRMFGIGEASSSLRIDWLLGCQP